MKLSNRQLTLIKNNDIDVEYLLEIQSKLEMLNEQILNLFIENEASFKETCNIINGLHFDVMNVK